MEEANNKHHCCTCNSFHGYYTKSHSCFTREDCGRCFKHGKVVNKHDCCKHWRANSWRRNLEKRDVEKLFKKVAFDIAVIKQFLDEQNDINL